MIERVDFTELPPEEQRQAWCDWLRHHTVDPADVVANPTDGGFIERDPDARQVRYLAYDRDDKGRHVVAPCGTKAVTSVHVVQLEAKPSAFPPFAYVAV